MINLVPDLPKPKTESASYFVEADPETAGARIVERVMSGMNPLGAFARTSLVRPSPCITQAARPAHRGP